MREKNISLEGKTILVTGSPGFIGANLVIRLLREIHSGTVISFDSLNDYYDPNLKLWRLSQIEALGIPSERVDIMKGCAKNTNDTTAPDKKLKHIFIHGNLAEKDHLKFVFETYHPQIVVNLAAQAGVRYCIDHPDEYFNSNLTGFFNMLETCRHFPVEHFVFASSSSVYGGNTKIPFSTEDKTDRPKNLYAATKKSAELLTYSYASLFGIPSTGLRFFTVYGPAGRPDMFYYHAADKLAAGETINIFNYGNCKRDFTYVDDIAEGILRVMQCAPSDNSGSEDNVPYRVYNIGGGQPENLLDFVSTLQEELVRAGVLPEDYDFEAHRELVGMQPGDIPVTYADSHALEEDFGFTPQTHIREGLRAFAEWYKTYKM